MLKLAFLATAVRLKGSRGSKFAKFVPHHIFGDQHLDVITAVVNHERVPNELGNHRAGSSPRLDWLLRTRRFRFLNFQEKLLVDVGAFFL